MAFALTYLDQLNELMADADFAMASMDGNEGQVDHFLPGTTVTFLKRRACDQPEKGNTVNNEKLAYIWIWKRGIRNFGKDTKTFEMGEKLEKGKDAQICQNCHIGLA